MNKMLVLVAAWMGTASLFVTGRLSIDLETAGIALLVLGLVGVVSVSFFRIVFAKFRVEGTDESAMACLLTGVVGASLIMIDWFAVFGAIAALATVVMGTVVAVRSIKFGTTHMRYVPILTVMVTGIASLTAAYSGWEWVQAATFSMVGWPLAFAFANFSDRRALVPADIGSASAG